MRSIYLILFSYLLFPLGAKAQSFHFELKTDLPLVVEGQNLANGWAGGLNAPQFSTIDLNLDGKDDLFVFERTSNKTFTFLNQNDTWVYAPDYEALFPQMTHWALLVDYNCDGKKDIWTPTTFGTRLFKNVSENSLTFELESELIHTIGRSGSSVNLDIDVTDIPAFVDVDNDGDLDILSFLPSLGGSIELNQNMSMEKYGVCDSLAFEKVTIQWGDFIECSCDQYVFGQNSRCRLQKTEHAGSNLLLFDADGDTDKDLIVGEIGCDEISFLENQGDPTSPLFSTYTHAFPNSRPIAFPSFPAVYHEDVNFDGKKDLIAAPNHSSNAGDLIDFSRSVYFYKNEDLPDFQFQQDDFLQHTMLDIGEDAQASFADADNDGDLDMFLSNRGKFQNTGQFLATLYFFENKGTTQQPDFELITDDFLRFSSLEITNLRTQFIALDADGKPDLVFSFLDKDQQFHLFYLPNTGDFEFDLQARQEIPIYETFSSFVLADLDNNDTPDLLLSTFNRGIKFFKNNGNIDFELADSQFGNLEGRNLHLTLSDLDQNGDLELITASQDNRLHIYPDITNDLEADFTKTSPFIWNKLTDDFIQADFGERFFPSVYENHIILGTNTGGVLFLENQQNVVQGLETDSNIAQQSFQIFPNPSSKQVQIRTNKPSTYQIFTVLGQKISTGIAPTKLDISNWESGVYLVKIGAQTQKLLIQH